MALSATDLKTIQEAVGRAKLQIDTVHEAVNAGPGAAAAAVSRLRQLADGNCGCGCGNCGCGGGDERATVSQ
jgi:hypothetical protein